MSLRGRGRSLRGMNLGLRLVGFEASHLDVILAEQTSRFPI
jgi:hypothetical protein